MQLTKIKSKKFVKSYKVFRNHFKLTRNSSKILLLKLAILPPGPPEMAFPAKAVHNNETGVRQDGSAAAVLKVRLRSSHFGPKFLRGGRVWYTQTTITIKVTPSEKSEGRLGP